MGFAPLLSLINTNLESIRSLRKTVGKEKNNGLFLVRAGLLVPFRKADAGCPPFGLQGHWRDFPVPVPDWDVQQVMRLPRLSICKGNFCIHDSRLVFFVSYIFKSLLK